uniref:Uncharacterized protein n=1 Tax=Opuntia streptacantha TaxID=393608 RepID=A0A7C8ZH09_OPUST
MVGNHLTVVVCQSHHHHHHPQHHHQHHLCWSLMEEVYWRTPQPDLLRSSYFFGYLLYLLPCSLKSRLLNSHLFFQDCFFLSPFIVELGAGLCHHFFLDLLTHLLGSCFLGSFVNTLIQPLRHFLRVIVVDGAGPCDRK